MGFRQAPEILKKNPIEVLIRAFEFSGVGLADGETLSSITSIAIEPDEVDGLAFNDEVIAGTQVRMTLSGGILNHSYEITVIVETSTGEVIKGCGKMNVLDC